MDLAVVRSGSRGARGSRACLLLLLGLALAWSAPAWGAEPPIPEFELWEVQMTSVGREHCHFLRDPRHLEVLLGHVYYDMERVFFQIADYTGDPSWNECAQLAEGAYRDKYVLDPLVMGGAQGFRIFTQGLKMDYERTGDTLSRDAVFLLSQNAAFAPDEIPLEWTAPEAASREVAFVIASYIHAQQLGAPPRARLHHLFEQALGHIDQWFVTQTWRDPCPGPVEECPRIAPFMVGLTAEALILYYEQVTPDPRIPPAIRLAMDWLFENAWIPDAEAFWLDTNDGTPAPDLNLLIAPAFAWLYRQTGDPIYRDRGDQVFAGGVKFGFLQFGKQFNQNYRWSFDYVRWRMPVANSAPVLDALSPAGTLVGGPGFTLVVTGQDFVDGAVVLWNGETRPTLFVDATRLDATISLADIAIAGTASVAVRNADGENSGSLSFAINNPVPVANSVSPSLVEAGGDGFTLTVRGDHFVATSVVLWNGAPRPTRMLSSTKLQATISAADIAARGTASIQVRNPMPGGGLSEARLVTIETFGWLLGAGELKVGGHKHHFVFSVKRLHNQRQARGKLEYWVEPPRPPKPPKPAKNGKKNHEAEAAYRRALDPRNWDRFVATAVTDAVFSDDASVPNGHGWWKRRPSKVDAADFTGQGRWNKVSGFTFEARAVAGHPGKRYDRFMITVRNSAGLVVGTVEGALTHGNIESIRIR